MTRYQTALVLGYGRSGQAAERLLLAEGTNVSVLAQETAGEPEVRQVLASSGFEVCIVSPGFALSHPWLCVVREAGIPLLSELELGWSRFKGKTVAVTGSNGKSTAVKWICESLRCAGNTAEIGGNYGIPACAVVQDHPELDWLVLEVSSFQLETVREFRADVAVLLNLLPNHLDRHETMENYRRTKARIFGVVSSSKDACLVPVTLLEVIQEDVGDPCRNWITFGATADADSVFSDGVVTAPTGERLDLRGTLFESRVLGGCTGAAVGAVATCCGVAFSAVEQAAHAFKPLPHRLQFLGEIGGISYVNDSKATNLAATAAALEACGRGIRLIAGGLPKESDYTFIKEVLAERVRSIYVIGQASRAMVLAWKSICPCLECGTLEGAFGTAQQDAEPGETILLSPGCASFDQFRSFGERGERFEALFRKSEPGGGDAG